jgi:hypothetical protein
MSRENLELVRRGYDAYARGDLAAMLKDTDSEVIIYPAGPSALATSRRFPSLLIRTSRYECPSSTQEPMAFGARADQGASARMKGVTRWLRPDLGSGEIGSRDDLRKAANRARVAGLTPATHHKRLR